MTEKRGSETFSGFNKPKRTPSHKTKSHAVLAKSGDKTKLIRFGQHNYAPSFGEIAEALDAKSRSSVTPLVSKLERRGYIERTPNLARSIRVVKSDVPQASVINDVPLPLPESNTPPQWGEE